MGELEQPKDELEGQRGAIQEVDLSVRRQGGASDEPSPLVDQQHLDSGVHPSI